MSTGGWARNLCRRVAGSSRLAAVFRHPIDAIPVGIMFVVFGAQLSVFLFLHDALRVLPALVLLFPVQVNFAGVCHNHHHVSTFRMRLANRAFEVVMFLQLGMLPFGYTLHHNIGHHRHYRDPARDSNRWHRRDGRPMGSWEFAVHLCLDMYPTVVRIGRRHPAIFRKFRRMAFVSTAVLLGLFAIDPVNAFLVFVLPLPFALLLQAQATYWQHVGLEAHDAMGASRSVVDGLYNLRTLNLGYHTAHHVRPRLHWSKLPALHAEIARAIPPELIG
ncbi:MAG TPA: fatty acid desaturase [Candidatus Binatia bacterium]|nr:fatty acid desaturase [Candidatus Binatia bacterium]